MSSHTLNFTSLPEPFAAPLVVLDVELLLPVEEGPEEEEEKEGEEVDDSPAL
jgi:hypothetical protein